MEQSPPLFFEDSAIAPLDPKLLNSVKYEWVEGRPITTPSTGKCFPTEEQHIFARMLLADLMEDFHHDGSWRIVWRDPVRSKWEAVSRMYRAYLPTTIEMQYLDKDGDVQFVVASDDSLDSLLNMGFYDIKENLMQAFAHWQGMRKALDLANAPTISLAKGEKPSNPAEQFAAE